MKTKNTKIKIKKNRILKEIDVLDDFKMIGNAVKDAGKMFKETFKRMFKTSVFGCKLVKALVNKDIKRIESLNKAFLLQDQIAKQNQESIISAQPGNKDLQMFLGMTSPNILMFDKFLNLSKPDIYEYLKGEKGQKEKEIRSKAAYYNLIMRIAQLTHDITPELNQNRDYSDSQLVKKYNKSVKNIMSTSQFKKGVAFLASLSKRENENYKDEFSIEVSTEMYKILYKIHEAEKESKIIEYIKKEVSYAYQIEIIVSALKSNNVQKKFKSYMNKFQYPESMSPITDETDADETDADETDADETDADETDADETDEKQNINAGFNYKTINIKKNIIIENKDLTIEDVMKVLESEGVDAKLAAKKSNACYALLRVYFALQTNYVSFKRNEIFLSFKMNILKDYSEHIITSEEKIKNLEKEKADIDLLTNNLNVSISKFNEVYKDYFIIPEITSEEEFTKSFTQYVSKTKEINTEHENALSQSANNVPSGKEGEYKKLLCYTKILSSLDENNPEGEKLSELIVGADFDKTFNLLKSTYNEIKKGIDFSVIKEDELFKNKFSIDIKTIVEADEIFNKLLETNNNIKKASETFNNFISNKSQIEKKSDDAESNLTMPGENQNSDDDSENFIDSLFDSENTQSSENVEYVSVSPDKIPTK